MTFRIFPRTPPRGFVFRGVCQRKPARLAHIFPILRIFCGAELVSGYGALVDAAAELPVPQDVPLKGSKDFTLIGTPARRRDTVPKTDGTAVCAA